MLVTCRFCCNALCPLSALLTLNSSQVAVEAAKEGVPAISVFGGPNGTTRSSFTTLTTDPNSAATKAALLYADLTSVFAGTLWNSGSPFLPSKVVLNINYPSIASCPTVADYTFVLAKFATDNIETVQTCGQTQLPLASDVTAKGCFASVTALNMNTFKDVSAAKQQTILDKMGSLIGCMA